LLNYSLTRHRPLLLVAGVSALVTALLRFYLYHADDGHGLQIGRYARSNTTFNVGLVNGLLGYLLLVVGLVLLALRNVAARAVLIASALVEIPAQVLMVIAHSRQYGSQRAITSAWFVLDTSLFQIFIIVALLLAGIGSTRRPKADPYDEYFFRERAAGGFSGFAFAISIGMTVLWFLQFLDDGTAFRRIRQPTNLLERLGMAQLVTMLAAACFGIVGWALMLARRRFAGVALTSFAALFLLRDIVELLILRELQDQYGFSLSFWWNWPPLGVVPQLAGMVETAGITLLGIVWSWRYYRVPARLDPGSAFEPMMQATPVRLGEVERE